MTLLLHFGLRKGCPNFNQLAACKDTSKHKLEHLAGGLNSQPTALRAPETWSVQSASPILQAASYGASPAGPRELASEYWF